MTEVNIGLASTIGGNTGDAAADTVFVNGTNGDDIAAVIGDASGTSVFGLAAQVNITGAEAANDRLWIGTNSGDDVIEASGVAVGAIQLTLSGGNNNDVLIGGDGNDTLLGSNGDDVLIGGPGVEILDGQEDDDIEIQLVAIPGDGLAAETDPLPKWAVEKIAAAQELKAKLLQ